MTTVLFTSAATRGADPIGGSQFPIAASSVSAKETMQAIDAGLAAVASSTEIDATLKTSLETIFQNAKQAIQDAEKLAALSAQYKKMAGDVAKDTAAVEVDTAEQNTPQRPIDSNATIESISQRLTAAKIELAQATSAATQLTAEPARRKKRLAEIPTEQSAAEQSLAEIREQLSQPAPANESELESQARVALLQARLTQNESRNNALQQEQAAYLATTELLPQRIALANAQVKRLRTEIDTLQVALADKQSSQVKNDTRRLKKIVDQVPEQLQQYALSNVDLAKTQQQMIQDSTDATKRLADIQEAFEDVKSDLTSSSERVTAIGLTDALGLMLREHREDYDVLRNKYRPNAGLKKKIQEYQIDAFRLEDEADKIDKKLAGAEVRSIDWQAANINWSTLSVSDAAWVLMNRRRKLIDDTVQAQNSLLQTMLTSDTQQHELLQAIDRYNAFADRNLFWTRSSPAFSIFELQKLPEVVAWYLQPSNWQSVSNTFVGTLKTRPLVSAIAIIFAIGMIVMRTRMRHIIAREGESARRYNTGYHTTLLALWATAMSAAVWPVGFGVASYLLLANSASNVFAHGTGEALAIVAIFISSRELLKETCRNQGLGDAHFGWNESVRMHLRRHLRWYMLFGGIGIFLLVTIHSHADIAVRTLGSRLTSTFLFLVTATFHHVILRPKSPIYVQIARSNPDSIVYRNRKLIWWFSILLPLSFAVMSMAGYLDTTFRLGRSLQSTFLLLVVVILTLGLISRWLTLHKRDVARKRARENRARLAAIDQTLGESGGSEVGIELEDEMLVSLPVLDHQTRQTAFALATLLGFIGLAFIWSDVLPALEYFDGVRLWQVGTGESIEAVTLLDAFYCVLAIVVLVFATRNLPSMLELLVLSRTTLDGGARYAITTLLRYVVLVIGGLIVLNLLSVPYNQLGWLVAAASVGLGFGLQEIVANFVSGIILLLERPVRVGDVVTIDGTTGTVSRIQMRATTVTSWDRKELVVPNKDLITQKLLNWSLSNVINRLTLEIGVEYGADPDKVRGILYRVVTQHPDVMKDPAPLINLETFGDSALVFHLRFFLPKLDSRIEVTHQINTAIANELQKAGISIPFPQRDLNFKLQEGQSGVPITLRSAENKPEADLTVESA